MNVRTVDAKDCHSEYSVLKKILNVGSGYSKERAMYWLVSKYRTDSSLPAIKLVNLQKNDIFEEMVEELKEKDIVTQVEWKHRQFPCRVDDKVILSLFSREKDTAIGKAHANLEKLGYYCLNKSSFRRRVRKLEYEGKLCRLVRIGGDGGSISKILRICNLE